MVRFFYASPSSVAAGRIKARWPNRSPGGKSASVDGLQFGQVL